MFTQNKKLSVSLPYHFPPNTVLQPENLLFFDIETTGLSADIASIYLIGCCYYQDNSWQMIQWFADDYVSEAFILQKFIEFAKTRQALIHFNGSGFDIPFIQKKLKLHNLSFSFDDLLSIDLYKKIKPYKSILQLENVKQKTVEDFLHIPRTDEYNGGQLIDVYVEYMKLKFIQKTSSDDHLKKLLLHNAEDVTNLITLTSIMAYCDLFECKHTVINAHIEPNSLCLILEFTFENTIQNYLFFQNEQISLEASKTNGKLSIQLYNGVLKYFYKNYKDYYYLPIEDCAIHKSVAQFVDKEHKKKATADTCYTKKSGVFAPQFSAGFEPKFQINRKDKQNFFELTEELFKNQKMLSNYVSSILIYILHEKKKKV